MSHNNNNVYPPRGQPDSPVERDRDRRYDANNSSSESLSLGFDNDTVSGGGGSCGGGATRPKLLVVKSRESPAANNSQTSPS